MKNLHKVLLFGIFISLPLTSVLAQTCSGSSIIVSSIQTCANGATITSTSTPLSNSFNEGTISNASSANSYSSFYVDGYSIGTLTNSGDIINTAGSDNNASAIGTTNNGSIVEVINFGTISGLNTYGIINGLDSTGGYIGTITNNIGATIFGGYSAIENYDNNNTISNISNSGSIIGGPGWYGVLNYGTITAFTNNSTGVISTTDSGYAVTNYFQMGNFINNGNISFNGAGGIGFYNGYYSVDYPNPTVNNFINNGSILGGADTYGIYNGNVNGATIVSLTNTGTISTGLGGVGIFNETASSIVTLNNLQGGNSFTAATTALTYQGNLPTNYNIIINSPTHYGQLAGASLSGATTFGIYAGSALSKGSYTSVLSGFTTSNLAGTTSGNYNGFTWSLNNSSGSIWDLIVTGASTADTQQSLVNTAASLQNTYTLQNSVLANSFTYDCDVFGANNICISAGGRNTAVQAANGMNNTSGLLIAAYRAMPLVRVGAYIDQNLSVNNAGSTVNLGNNTPLIGLFGVWSERQDGTGTQVKVSAAYGQKNTTITRQVVGTSEAGSGSSQLNSQGAQVVAKYGFGITENTVLSPYVGMRYTQNNMGGYTEGTSATVTAPLTYSALNTNATTALAGVGAHHRLTPKATLFASAGIESDTNASNGTYSATGINGLTSVNFNANPVTTRPTASVGATYLVEKNQQLGLSGIYRQEPYQAVSTTTVMATYTVGL
ncbi:MULTISPECIES: autotransporter outer membrane beta-barrel domain-containing protein [unclassified Polynucleobacter]|uniref:beta strand repeat-containing protein n=1 Tax=unclassified Polynucleobacter TaxID=2640945 RepID=UPI0008BF5B84|nr:MULTISPECIES: autotransporter outer membrane beta-barrel domain-containing protein [unclassified Polynucleobacter]OHC10225.1 MAG: hypothetical protein A2X74_10815 [Polynucleobacter sp. GWA2_45_21]HBK43727.1 hypothetical protein [Polynucleobacter sp.]